MSFPRCFRPSPLFPVFLTLVLAASAAQAQDLIFSDGFESGDASAWSASVPPIPAAAACPAGPAVGGVLEGDLGPAPGGSFELITCVEITNDQAFERGGEVAFSSIPLPQGLSLTDTSSLVLVGPGARRLAAQFDVLSRWGGTMDDVTRPIRWLEVSVRPRVGAGGTVSYALRSYDAPGAAADPFAATVGDGGGGLVSVDTGLATFYLDPANPALFDHIDIDSDDDGSGRTTVYQHQGGAGPRLEFDPGGGTVVLDTATPGRVSVDPGGFEVVESGPVKVVVSLRGHFVAPGGASLCSPFGETPYERFGYTLVATFERGRRDVGLEVNVRNECSDAFGGSWTDDAIQVEGISWEFPFPGLSTPTTYHAGSGALGASAAGFAGQTVVEQRHGAGNPWSRRARVTRDGATLETGEALARPLVALADADLVVAASMPWMRYREPQALAVDGTTLSLRFVGESLVVGEAKGLWNVGRLVLLPFTGAVAPRLETLRDELVAALEHGLLVRAPRDHVNTSHLFASLGTDATSPVKTHYLNIMETFHHDTVDAGGQWHRAKTFGSQLWPDIQFDAYAVDFPADPADNDVPPNYWNPSGAELLEFLRSGNPKWVWDFALPQSRLQMYSAYVNLGEQNHGNRNGAAATSGGSGQGHWHRSSFGSDDYSYNAGMHLAYALRPSPALRDRFAQAGRMVVGRYSVPQAQQGTREQFVEQVDITRQVIQHFELLANCAEFVSGADGAACQARLLAIVDELARENLRAGILCQDDIPSTTVCAGPQRFMVAALFYHFFHRYLLNWGDVDGLIERALVGEAVNYYQQGLPKLGDGVGIDPGEDWAALLDCNLTAGGTAVGVCTPVEIDGSGMLWHNKPHTVALLLMAHELDPSIGLCAVAKAALDDPVTRLGWDDNVINAAGWWKGAAQMVQGAVFGVGLYDVCAGL